ncbi:NAD-dependent epimerase/dehydratase family protein [Tenacibaculum jejuense]|uniref:NAD dependent epimerase/dehydratase family protein n=1 Tax=Tenacibaculum jejuense TaxID=584609 RepID=A0A238U4T9_9FLAO|nr:NAD-dependent epimerase/dehydratase family protein [Tenacibaculum jejuense]SNR14055.1 NAD dependent epimerase/dehydratase family protein [Tenacibaculum jejuense]
MILVTGGTGLVGSHLLYFLTKENDDITAIYRSKEKITATKKVFSYYTENYNELFDKIHWIQADIIDIPSLEKVFSKSYTYVYHCAALVSFDPKDYQKMRKVNIEGTANLVNFSIENTVKKFCFVSSIAAVGDAINNEIVNEENEWVDTKDKHGYAISKYGAEMEVWRGSQENMDVVIVNPGVILGSGFFHEGSGKMFSQIQKGLKFYTEGITGFVGVKDVVKSLIMLANSNTINERFILISENKSFKEIFQSIAKNLNVKEPKIKISKLVTSVAWRIDWFLTLITGKQPFLTKNSARSAHNKEYYSSQKIIDTLDFGFEPIEKVIEDVCNDYLK